MSILTTGRFERPATGYVTNTQELRKIISQQTEEYLRAGGRIVQVPGFERVADNVNKLAWRRMPEGQGK